MESKEEIERKWLLSFSPESHIDRSPNKTFLVTQFYIERIRIREFHSISSGFTRHHLTIKSDGNLTRNEFEIEIPEETYDLLLSDFETSNSGKKPIRKYIYEYSIENGLTIEIHGFLDNLLGLAILECEFPNEDATENFELPDWISEYVVKEVTEDDRYQNKNLAVNGMPEPLIIDYTRLLHKYKDPKATPVKEFFERHQADEQFIRRAEMLNKMSVLLK